MEQNISLQIGDTSLLRSKKLRFYLEIVLLYAIIFARNILELSIPVGLILAYSFIIALGSCRDEIFALSVCCIPLPAGSGTTIFGTRQRRKPGNGILQLLHRNAE